MVGHYTERERRGAQRRTKILVVNVFVHVHFVSKLAMPNIPYCSCISYDMYKHLDDETNFEHK